MKKKEKTQLTPEGLQDLEKELDYRRNTKKKELSEILGAATEKGDLSENDEYNIALEDSLANEARIAELVDIIKNSEIVKTKKSHKAVSLGHKVKIKDAKGNERTLHVVGETEANPTEGKISNTSPMGKGLIGKAIKEKFCVATPNGDNEYTILSIE